MLNCSHRPKPIQLSNSPVLFSELKNIERKVELPSLVCFKWHTNTTMGTQKVHFSKALQKLLSIGPWILTLTLKGSVIYTA